MAEEKQASYRQFPAMLGLTRLRGIRPSAYTMHEHFELYRVRSGSVEVTVDGITQTLFPGDIVLLAPFVFHRNAGSDDLELEVLTAAPHICPELSRIFGVRKPASPIMTARQVPPFIAALLDALIDALLRSPNLQAYLREDKDVYHLSRENCAGLQPYLSVLLLELGRSVPMQDSDGSQGGSMHKILQYCTANFHQELNRKSVAQACQVSPGLISLTFRQMGTSFRDYINHLRVNHAYTLLMNTKKPITEIIYESGFSNQGTFNKNFQSCFGKSPRDIRHGR